MTGHAQEVAAAVEGLDDAARSASEVDAACAEMQDLVQPEMVHVSAPSRPPPFPRTTPPRGVSD